MKIVNSKLSNVMCKTYGQETIVYTKHFEDKVRHRIEKEVRFTHKGLVFRK